MKELQEVSVVARDFDDPMRRTERQPPHHRLRVVARVRYPALGHRGEVGVVAEDVRRCGILTELHEEAAVADPGLERVECFAAVQLVATQVRVRERRGAEIREAVAEWRGAEATTESRAGHTAPVPRKRGSIRTHRNASWCWIAGVEARRGGRETINANGGPGPFEPGRCIAGHPFGHPWG